MTQHLRRVGVVQAAKMSGMLCFFIGAVIAGIMFLVSMVIPMSAWSGSAGMMGFGIGALVVLPVFYAVIGFVGGAIYAWLYNLVAGWVGGLELDIE